MIKINNFRNSIDSYVPIFCHSKYQIYINHDTFHLYENCDFSEKLIIYNTKLINYKTISNYNKRFNKDDLH